MPFGPFSKGTSNHFTRVSEATLSPSQLDGVLPLRMSRSHAAGAWPARCHTICKASHSLTFSRPALFHGPRCSRKFWAPRVGGRGGSPYIYISSPYITIYRCDDSGYPLGLHRGAFRPRTWQSSSNAATPRIKRGTSHGDPLCAGRVIPASLGILDSDL